MDAYGAATHTVKPRDYEPGFFQVSLNRFLHKMVVSTSLGYLGS